MTTYSFRSEVIWLKHQNMSGYFEKSRPAPGSNMLTGYMESRLTSVHNKSAQSVVDYKWKLAIFIMSVVSLTLLPYIHIGMFHNVIDIFYSDTYRFHRMSHCQNSCL